MNELTPREWQVAELQATGLSHKEIACRLGISLSTTKTHLTRMFAKTNVQSSLQFQQRIGPNLRLHDLRGMRSKIQALLVISDQHIAKARTWKLFKPIRAPKPCD
jgi:DNA-binding NarL/FixJ family response regulator